MAKVTIDSSTNDLSTNHPSNDVAIYENFNSMANQAESMVISNHFVDEEMDQVYQNVDIAHLKKH